MKTIYNYFFLLLLVAASALTLGSCSDDNRSDLALDGSTMIRSLKLGGYDADIDNAAKTVFVGVSVDCDLSAITLDDIQLSDGATTDYHKGDVLDCTIPHTITVVNGDVFTDYTLIARHDNVEVVSAMLGGKYTGSVDNAARTIKFFVPVDEDVTTLQFTYTLSEGATGNPASGVIADFTDPVTFSTSFRTAKIDYQVIVIKDDMSQAPKAFVGIASSIDGLGNEAKAAAVWMLANVPNSRYVSLQNILNGSVKLSDFKMVWCHFDWLDWPGLMWDTRDLFNDYYIKGGSILATRDGARYINDVWRISKDQQSPNNMFGGEVYETLETDLGCTVSGHESHPIFAGIPVADGKIMLASKGCSNSNRTLQWIVDWDAYGNMQVWEEKSGAKALASGNDANPNAVTIAEFAPRDILSGYTSGTVITIGTPGYEWHISNGMSNAYQENIIRLTKNSINYLCK